MDARSSEFKYESTRMSRREKVIYDPTTSLARFERDMRTERERRYAWAERQARKRLTTRSQP
jgi:hypothetical protein